MEALRQLTGEVGWLTRLPATMSTVLIVSAVATFGGSRVRKCGLVLRHRRGRVHIGHRAERRAGVGGDTNDLPALTLR
ncbi:hypothetical protein FHX81_0413 [Saccharothrix saharensis]|uniref:Uncharacterized protein n=1 Tax=Saccharothrix saharensis TaxID=571190 RepID=A0A543J5Q3_9PSEU|nr:hypothetical protein [Saccharothrix saharensis]TQM78159.1 hypothetical protein FHX81_0413 [Saccharothrix saharensis]